MTHLAGAMTLVTALLCAVPAAAQVYISVDMEGISGVNGGAITIPAPDTVQFSRASMPEAYRLIRVLYRFINPD